MRRPVGFLLPATVLATALLASSPLGAQCDDLSASPTDAATAASLLGELESLRCLGSPGKPCLDSLEAICAATDALTNDDATHSDPAAAFFAVGEAILAVLPPGEKEDHLRLEIRRSLVAVQEEGEAEAGPARFRPAPGELVLFRTETTEIDLERLLAGNCPAACPQTYRRSVTILTLSALYRRSLAELLEDDRERFLAGLATLDARWETYFTQARSQYPWELAVNSIRFRRSSVLVGPPSDQVILLHPSLALELVDGGDGEEFQDAVVLELAGYHRWSWKGAAIKRPLGIAAVASWRGGAADEVGWGAIAHLPRSWSLGAVYRSADDLTLLVSADLAKLFTNGRGVYERVIGRGE